MKSFQYVTSLIFLVAIPAFSAEIKTEEAAAKIAIDAVRKFQLTELKDDCRVFDAVESRLNFDIIVREHHSPSCGGTPETAPRLFTVRIRKRDGRLTSDVYDGTNYRPLDHKIEKSK